MFSKKATKIDKIFTVNLTLCSKCQIVGEDFANFRGLLRKYELYICIVYTLLFTIYPCPTTTNTGQSKGNFSKLSPPTVLSAYCLVSIILNSVLGEYPWQAYLKVPCNATRTFICGGVLVSRQHIVTVSNHFK